MAQESRYVWTWNFILKIFFKRKRESLKIKIRAFPSKKNEYKFKYRRKFF